MKIGPIKNYTIDIIKDVFKKENNFAKWDKSVDISYNLDGDVYNSIYKLKSTIGNYADYEGLKVKFDNAPQNKLLVEVENALFSKKMSDTIDINLKPSSEKPSFSRQIFQKIVDLKNNIDNEFLKTGKK